MVFGVGIFVIFFMILFVTLFLFNQPAFSEISGPACWVNGRNFNFCCRSNPSPCGVTFYATCCSDEVSSRESSRKLHVELSFEYAEEDPSVDAFRRDSWLVAFRFLPAYEVLLKHANTVDPMFPAPGIHSLRFYSQLTLRILDAIACFQDPDRATGGFVCEREVEHANLHLQEVPFFALMSVNWPLSELLDMLQHAMISRLPRILVDHSCFESDKANWQELWNIKDSVRSNEGGMLPTRLLMSDSIANSLPDEILSRGECPGGVFLVTFMMTFITAQSEVGCVSGFTEFLQYHMRSQFIDFLTLTAPWNFFAWVSRLGRQISRHKMQHGLSEFDLEVLGVSGFTPLSCFFDRLESTVDAEVRVRRSWTPSACRNHCHEYPFFAVSSDISCHCLIQVPTCSNQSINAKWSVWNKASRR